MNKDDLRMWFGLNLPDAILTIGMTGFVIPFLTNNLVIILLSYTVGTIFLCLGFYIYFKKPNTKASKETVSLNKWINVVIISVSVPVLVLAKLILFLILNR